ncbi:MAG TPA: hypothetical protein VHB21_21610, partial [Minicystis sp.]|nr:hypothetical protein [Minicystis sp.]
MVTFRARELSFDDAPRARQRLGVWAVGLFSFAVLGSLLFPDFAPHVAGLLATAGVVAAFASRAKAGGLVSLGSGELRVGDAHVEIAPARGGA